jgi:glycosyltransferase involved in cell wall biosynthesis
MYFPHKNHKLIIDSLKIINFKNKEDVSAIFCGFDKGYLQNLKEYSKIINVDDKIIFFEFIDDDEIPFFYINSLALVMPTLMGPNNIPPWEAFRLRVPVFYSKFGNIETVLKNAAIYIDQFDPKDLADGIVNLMHDEKIRDNLIKSGENLLNSINKKKDYESLLNLIIKNRTIKERWNLF